MNDLTVIEHHLDEQEGVYRLVVGYETTVEVVALDEAGDPIMLDPEPMVAHVPVYGPDDEPVMTDDQVAMRPKLEMREVKTEDDKKAMALVPTGEMEPVVDEDGNEVRVGGKVVTREEHLHGEDGEPLYHPAQPMLTERVERVPVEDFVFAAHDERWEGKTPKQIATAQRKLVKAALDERAAASEPRAAAATSGRTDLPGVGEGL